MSTIRFDRLVRAYEIISGVPVRALDLRAWSATGRKINPHRCGTLGCAAGLLTVHPEMRAEGLTHDFENSPVFGDAWRFDALREFFALPTWDDAAEIFGRRRASRFDTQEALDRFSNDRDLWLYRVRAFLREHHYPVQTRDEGLA